MKGACSLTLLSSPWTRLWSLYILVGLPRVAPTPLPQTAVWRTLHSSSELMCCHCAAVSPTITEDTISNELQAEAQIKRKKKKQHLHEIFDLPPAKPSSLLLCFWGQVVIWEFGRLGEGVDENLISQSGLIKVLLNLVFILIYAEPCFINSFIYRHLKLN